MTRTEWLLEKKKYVTSTDIASLLGIGFQTPEEVYHFKTTPELEEEEPNEMMKLGIYLEPYIDGLVKERLLIEYQRSGYQVIRSARNNFQATSIDLYRWVALGKYEICETKAIFGYPTSEWGPDGSDLIPEKYILQCQHQMGVLELQEMWLAALFVGYGFRMYKIRFNPSLFALISYVEEVFWDIVQRRLGMDGWDDFIASYLPSIREYTPKIQQGLRIDLDPESEALIENYMQAVDIWSQMEEEAASLKQRLCSMMGEAEIGESEKYRIRRPLVKAKNPYRKFIVEAKDA